jgi:Icc-related predicted phosphoesterase
MRLHILNDLHTEFEDFEPPATDADVVILAGDIGVGLGGQRFTPDDAIRLHSASRDWLAVMLAEPFEGKTVVVTHHAPSSLSVHPRYAKNLLTPAFASNLENLMDGHRVVLWVHGHMHDPFDYEVYGTRIICNPRGYAPNALTSDFRPDLVVDI